MDKYPLFLTKKPDSLDKKAQELSKDYAKKLAKDKYNQVKDEGGLGKKVKDYMSDQTVDYEGSASTEDKNAKKAKYGLGIGTGITVGSQIAAVTWIPGVNIVVGLGVTGYGVVKGIQWYKDRRARKKREKQQSIDDKLDK